jgi:glycosyltransferase involved in cell wall biosynthesis
MSFPGEPRISVVIPCHNGARFLGETIESVLKQRLPAAEIIVVDDGSTDDSLAVVARYPGVRAYCQAHAGVAAARNAGLRYSTGDYLVFLDHDDRLLPDALGSNLACLLQHPRCALSFGDAQCIDARGAPLPRQSGSPHEGEDHYLSLLRGSYIWTPGAVLYRRTVLEAISGFDVRLGPVSDTALHLRIARDHPICHNNSLVIEKRLHLANQGNQAALLLTLMIQVLQDQKAWICRDPRSLRAFEDGVRSCLRLYGRPTLAQLTGNLRKRRRWRETCTAMLILLQYTPLYLGGRLTVPRGMDLKGQPTKAGLR